jgi:hypothetical protein
MTTELLAAVVVIIVLLIGGSLLAARPPPTRRGGWDRFSPEQKFALGFIGLLLLAVLVHRCA